MSSAIRKRSPSGGNSVNTSPAPSAGRGTVRAAAQQRASLPRDSRTSLAANATDHIKRIPQPKALRERLRRQAALAAEQIARPSLPKKSELEQLARALLADLKLPEGFAGWTMVMLASEFWRPSAAAVPFDRRLLLLPGNLLHGPACATTGSAAAATVEASAARQAPDCAACAIDWLKSRAERLGYRTLRAEDSVAVLAALAGAEIDAVMGVASLDLLEKAIDQIPQFEIPCMAIPLLDAAADDSAGVESNACGTGKRSLPVLPELPFDADWILRMIELPHIAADPSTPNYRHLIRAARRMFEPAELESLAPRMRTGSRPAHLNGQGAASLDPLAGTEAIAYDFLTRGGKHSRPFITLAVYDAMTGGRCAASDGHRAIAELPLVGQTGGRVDRNISQSVAGTRRHRRRRRISLWRGHAPSGAWACRRRSTSAII